MQIYNIDSHFYKLDLKMIYNIDFTEYNACTIFRSKCTPEIKHKYINNDKCGLKDEKNCKLHRRAIKMMRRKNKYA